MSITQDFFTKEIALELGLEERNEPLIKELLHDDSEESSVIKENPVVNVNDYLDPTCEITLECLMNRQAYSKYLKQEGVKMKHNLKDKHFYKKRIYDLTKSLMHNEISPSEEINRAFDNYVNRCIQYFKILDTTDILQQDYAGIEYANTCSNTSLTDYNEYITKQIKYYQPNSLEKLIKRTIIQSDKPAPILPKQKDINLKDPALRVKGIKNEPKNDPKNELKHDPKNELIGKNNNIDNIHEEVPAKKKKDS